MTLTSVSWIPADLKLGYVAEDELEPLIFLLLRALPPGTRITVVFFHAWFAISLKPTNQQIKKKIFQFRKKQRNYSEYEIYTSGKIRNPIPHV